MALSINWVLFVNALLFRIYIKAPDFVKLPFRDYVGAIWLFLLLLQRLY